eukprot:SAG31_NODE_4714_length_3012_cov_26.602815_5_plen_120_part_00
MLFVSLYDKQLDLDVWRAQSAVRRFGMSIARVVIFTHGGQLDLDHKWSLCTSTCHPSACSGVQLCLRLSFESLANIVLTDVAMLGGAATGLLFGNIANRHLKVDARKLHYFIVRVRWTC